MNSIHSRSALPFRLISTNAIVLHRPSSNFCWFLDASSRLIVEGSGKQFIPGSGMKSKHCPRIRDCLADGSNKLAIIDGTSEVTNARPYIAGCWKENGVEVYSKETFPCKTLQVFLGIGLYLPLQTLPPPRPRPWIIKKPVEDVRVDDFKKFLELKGNWVQSI